MSPRLKKIADSIADCETIADIGTDHAYLPIFLIKNNKVKSAIASDINDGPVKIAQSRVAQYRVGKNVEIRKGSGLEVLKTGEAQVIVIAGMGGILITEILEKDFDIASSADSLILQPMRDANIVRKWLCKNGFEISDEELVKDEGKIYEIIWCKYSGNCIEADDVMLVGKQVLSKKHPLAAEFIDKRIKELDKIVASITDKDSENCTEKLNECKRLLDYYWEARQWV